MITKTCIICGKPFQAYPSDNTVTCSPACRSIRAARAASSHPHKWSEEAKKRRSKDQKILSHLNKIRPISTDAKMENPEDRRGPQNRESKDWVLIDPSGQHIKVKNLLDWARNNYTLFEPETADPDIAARRISGGFRAIACSIRGVKSRKRPVSTYKGWGLYDLPTKENDDDG